MSAYKTYKNKRNLRRLAAALQVSVFAAAMGVMPVAYAATLPTGYDADPSVSITPISNGMRISGTNTNNVIKWTDFSVGNGYKVIFDGKNYLNYVTAGDYPSIINGSINYGSGRVYLLNPNGITIGSTASFTGSGSFIASTKDAEEGSIINDFRLIGTVVEGTYNDTNRIVNNLATSLSNADITLEDKDITIKYINSADDFTAAGGERKYEVYLTKDITYNAPIGLPFEGTFDGNGHTITLNINQQENDGVGLFEEIEGSSTVKNLNLTGSVIGGNNVGALVGVLNSNATIEKVFNEANVQGRDNVGALIGSVTGCGSTSSGTVIIDKFKNTGKITSTASPTKVGEVIGIVDENGGSSLIKITISNGEVTNKRLVGKEFNNQVVTITNKPDITYNGYGPENYIKVEKVEIVQPPQPEPEPQPEPQPEPGIPDIRSIQDAINAARPSGTSDTDDIEKSNLLGDSHAGFMMNNTNAVREVSVDEEQLAAILGENGEAQPSAEGIGFSTRLTGETQTTTEQVEGMFTGDNVAEVES